MRQRREVGAARSQAVYHNGRSVHILSIASPDRTEADVGELAALRTLADVLGELLRIERLERAVLALDAGDDQRFAVAHRDIRQGNVFRQRDELHADATIGPLWHLVDGE